MSLTPGTRLGPYEVAIFRGEDGLINVWTGSSSAGIKRYEPAPFATRLSFGFPGVRFSPDGRQILMVRNAGAGEEAWLMPYPASATNPPHQIFQGLSSFNRTPTFSWMPDSRRVVLSASPGAGPRQLYLADTITSVSTVIFSGTTAQNDPVVSPDGSKLAFLETLSDRDVVSVDLATAKVTPVLHLYTVIHGELQSVQSRHPASSRRP